MNTTTRKNLTLALSAALFAGASLTSSFSAAADDFQAYAAETRAQVRAQLTAQPAAADRVEALRSALTGARISDGLASIPAQGELANSRIQARALANVRDGAISELARLVRTERPAVQVAGVGPARDNGAD